MRNRLYYVDPMIRQFSGVIEKVTADENNKLYIVLNNTAFYPTGGGQGHDTGSIGEWKVIDVEEVDGEIRHYIEETIELPQVGAEVACAIDWERRFDHMQQHCGQHILTAAFVELFNYPTVSFHLGTETVTIDLQTSSITEEQLRLAEKRANEIILENRSIETIWVTAEEAQQYPLRKALKVEEDIRLVIIPNYDYNGCGGTHPTSTGQVQALKILSIEKMKQNIRVHFVCGGRVLNSLQMHNEVLSEIAKQLSSPKENAHSALHKYMEQTKQTERALNNAKDALLMYEAKEMIAANSDDAFIIQTFENRTIQELQKLARSMTEQKEALTVCLIASNEDKYQIVCAKGKAAQSGSMKEAMQQSLSLIGGKGGGNDLFAQGGGDKLIPLESLIAAIKQFIRG